MQGATALWTAAHYRFRRCSIIANTPRLQRRDPSERDGEPAATGRARTAGLDSGCRNPELDMVKISEGQGVEAIGPVTSREELRAAIKLDWRRCRTGGRLLIDVHIAARSCQASRRAASAVSGAASPSCSAADAAAFPCAGAAGHQAQDEDRDHDQHGGDRGDGRAQVIFDAVVHCRGMVFCSGPAEDTIITTSSSEVAKAMTAPDTIPGSTSGSITLKKTRTGWAPRLRRRGRDFRRGS